MGKQKRARQKYHLACVKAKEIENVNHQVKSEECCEKPLSWNIQPSENIFAGLDIDFNNLKKSLIDDDGRSVKSISKSIKSSSGRQLKKNDKKKLRHNLFIQKIDTIYAKMKESKKTKKKKEDEMKEETSTVEYLLNKNPIKIKNTPPISSKQRGIKKANQRKEMMLKDVDLFKKILTDPKFVSKPLEHVRSSVQEKVIFQMV